MNLDEFKERYELAVVERALAKEAADKKAEKKAADAALFGKEEPPLSGVRFPRQLPITVVRQETDCCMAGADDGELDQSADSEESDDEEYDEEEELESLRTDMATACSLLQTAMHHLGFYGDEESCGPERTFSRSDQMIMSATAEEIEEFIKRVWDESYG